MRSWHTVKKSVSFSLSHTQMSNCFCNHSINSTWYLHSFYLIDKCFIVITVCLLTPTTGFVSCTLFIPVPIMHSIAQIILQIQNILVNTELSCYENSFTIMSGLPAGWLKNWNSIPVGTIQTINGANATPMMVMELYSLRVKGLGHEGEPCTSI